MGNSEELSITRIREKGTFERLYVRKGKKKRVRVKRGKEEKKRNKAKVVLCKMGEWEVYVYPYAYPDRVFIGEFPYSVQIYDFNINDLFKVFNKIRWFLNGEWEKPQNATKTRKGLFLLREHIKQAYNFALKKETSKEKP